jgi:hypothetical protein
MTLSAERLSLDRLAVRIPAPLRYGLCFLLLAGMLAAMIVDRVLILRNGTEVRLDLAPVDPRDFFRGDYVTLAYGIGELRLDRLAGDRGFVPGDAIFVTLQPGPDGLAVPTAVHRRAPKAAAPAVVIRGRVEYAGTQPRRAANRAGCAAGAGCLVAGVTYGIESYFVPEGEGRTVETTEKSRLEIVAAVSGRGEAAIKRLLVDGRTLYAEPLY